MIPRLLVLLYHVLIIIKVKFTMSMRARKESDPKSAPKLTGDHKEAMNSMFDKK